MNLKVPFAKLELVSILLLAFAVRLQNWMTIPPLTDEFKEVGWAMDMLQAHRFPLVAVDSYDGPLFAYANALLFSLFGFNIYSPRALVLAVGVLTVLAAYFLGQELANGDARAGLFAALLLALNSFHILFDSHVAWSNSTTPFFTTLTLFCYLSGTRRSKPWSLVAAGVLFGLALQTHPSALVIAPALLLDFFWNQKTRAQLRTFTPYAAVVAATLAYSPVLYYNLTNGLGSLTVAQQQQYALEIAPTLQSIGGNLARVIFTLAQVGIGNFGDSQWGGTVAWGVVVLFWTFTGAAAIYLARRGERLPLFGVLGAIGFYAVFNRFYALPDSARYFEPIIPLFFAASSILLFAVWDKSRAADNAAKYTWRALCIGTSAVIFIIPFVALQTFYADSVAQNRTNVGMLKIVRVLQDNPGQKVYLDYSLNNIRTGRGGAVAANLRYLLRLSKRDYQLLSLADPSTVRAARNAFREVDSAYLITYANSSPKIGFGVMTPLILTRFPCSGCGDPPEWGLYWWENPEAQHIQTPTKSLLAAR